METSNTEQSRPQSSDERVTALRRYGIVDTIREASFDEIVAAAAMLCKAPAAAINFIEEDRQWTKATYGVETLTASMEQSLCAHTIRQPDVLIVKDIVSDERFGVKANGPPSPHRFYAGAPIMTADGHRIGTLCILDLEPRELEEEQKTILRVLARRAMTELELKSALEKERSARREAEQLLKEKEELLTRNDVLMREIDHRMKNSLQLVASMLALQARGLSDKDAQQSLLEAQQRIGAIAALHEQLYRVSDGDRVDLREFLQGLCASLSANRPDHIGRVVVEAEPIVVGSKRAMKVGLLVNELVTNAFKHAYETGQRGDVSVKLMAKGDAYQLVVRDEGVGLPSDFDTGQSRGLGMRLVRSIVEQVGATMTLREGAGAAFTIEIPFN